MVCDGGMANVMASDVWFNDVPAIRSSRSGHVECTMTPRDWTRRTSHRFGGPDAKTEPALLWKTRSWRGGGGQALPRGGGRGNNQLRGYLNGKEVLSTNQAWSFEGNLSFGAGLDNRSWLGTLDGIALYNRILTADEVKAEYEAYRKVRQPARRAQRAGRGGTDGGFSGVHAGADRALCQGDGRLRVQGSQGAGGKLDASRIRVAHWTVLDRDPTRLSTLPVGAPCA